MRLSGVLFLAVLLLLSSVTQVTAQTAILRPTQSAMESPARTLGIPFYQAIPFAPGMLQPHEAVGLRVSPQIDLPVRLTTHARWPDGSVRWLAAEGIWPPELALSSATPVEITPDPTPAFEFLAPQSGAVRSLHIKDNLVHLVDAEGGQVMTLSPQAAFTTITEPKEILPDSIPDTERQYAWAEPLAALNHAGTSQALEPQIRDCIVEASNEFFTVYRIRGNGADLGPGESLEWQLRVRIYHVIPVVRLQMSWSLHWNPESFALTCAQWVATPSSPISQVYIDGLDAPVDLDQKAVGIYAAPSGHSSVAREEDVLLHSEWPNEGWHSLVATTGNTYLAVGTVNLTRLGPNHVEIGNDSITLAAWSPRFGSGLDLRSTALPDEFGMNTVDGASMALGVTRTLESTLIWADDAGQAHSLANLEARRDNLWLPARTEIVKAQVLGPWSEGAFFSNNEFFTGLHANLHFMVASRDHWRWNGWANFGDVRTNFASANQPDRGLHAQRWALHGRYGWRNGSSSPANGLWFGGLGLEDRALCLAAIDYTLHVADVDVSHASFYGPPRPSDGGMHRRNKDHWSGSVQMQYTPNDHLYLTYWLTGHERLHETLEEVRDYALRQGQSGSVFAAQALIHRYMETHDLADLEEANRLLIESTGAWERRGSPLTLEGLAALYADNFRLTLDGIPVLIQFYEATGDAVYLEAVRESIQAQGLPAQAVPSLAEYHGLAYLLLSGYTEEELGSQLTAQARNQVHQFLSPLAIPPQEEWDYETLQAITLQHLQPPRHAGFRESLSIGHRGAMAPVVIHAFGLPPREFALQAPETAYVGRTGARLVDVDLRRLHAEEAIAGAITLEGLPDGLKATPLPLPYELGPGQTETTLQFTIEAMPHMAPGAYTVTATDPIRPELTTAMPVSLPGWHLTDDFRPPMQDSWFGSFSFEVAEERSGGWRHHTDDHFDDPDRLSRVHPTREHLIYDVPGLYDFALTFYAPLATLEQVAGQIEFAFASNGEWLPLPTTLEWEACGSNHVKAKMSLPTGHFTGDGKLRLSVGADGDADYPQLGFLEIRGWH